MYYIKAYKFCQSNCTSWTNNKNCHHCPHCNYSTYGPKIVLQNHINAHHVKESDKPSTREWKTKQIKDFLVNAGVRDFSDDSKAMNDAIGNSLMVTFISEEYIGINKDNKDGLD